MTRISSKRLRRRRRPNLPILFFILSLLIFLGGLTVLVTYQSLGKSSSPAAPDFSGESVTHTKPKRVAPGVDKKEKAGGDDDDDALIRMRSWKAKNDGMDTLKLIQRGEVHLTDISRVTFHDDDDQPYTVRASFCHVDWPLHKKDPSSVPMFKYIVEKSRLCRQTDSVDLYTAVQAAREYDELLLKTKDDLDDNERLPMVHTMEPKGFVFHESRCGSTLVANSLAAFEPDLTRVYSESGPPVAAAKAFDKKYTKSSTRLLQDVIYLMGRSNDLNEENLFFKIQSIGSKSIWAFREAFPSTPWIYVYREPVQVMMSHVAKEGTTRAVCLRTYQRPTTDMKQLIERISGKSSLKMSLTPEEHCAAHLATLCEAAAVELRDSNGRTGRAVNYEDLPDILISDIIPKHFLNDSELSDEAIERIEQVSGKYSKGGDKRKVWTDEGDSKKKEDNARPAIRDASEKYLYPVYRELEKFKDEYA